MVLSVFLPYNISVLSYLREMFEPVLFPLKDKCSLDEGDGQSVNKTINYMREAEACLMVSVLTTKFGVLISKLVLDRTGCKCLAGCRGFLGDAHYSPGANSEFAGLQFLEGPPSKALTP